MSKRAAGWLFAVVTAVQLFPIWSVRYMPTNDGPAHLYNALILHDVAAGRKGAIADTYAIDPRPHPNWIGHAVMAALMFAVSPLIAEKLLVSAIVIVFLGAVWLLARESSPAYAFLGFPFTYHAMLQTGFYNFSIAAALCIAVIAVWWRRRDQPDGRTIALVGALLVLCYFSHALPLAIACVSIGILWVVTLRGRRFSMHARHLIAFVPVAPLVVWFALRQGTGTVVRYKPVVQSVRDFAEIRILLTFSKHQVQLGALVFAAMVILAVISAFDRRREANAFLPIFPLLFALYLWAPETIAGGQMFAERVAVCLYLLPIAWFSPRAPRHLQFAIAILFSVIGVANALFIANRWKHYEKPMRDIVEAAKVARPDSRLLPVMFDRRSEGAFVPLLWHAAAYAAAERRFIDLDNYEPRTAFFPTKLRDPGAMPDFGIAEITPERLDVAGTATYANYVATWKLPPGSPVSAALDRLYRVVASRGYARLYERRSAPGIDIGTREQVLLPMAGTRGEVGGVLTRWRIDQSVTNHGRETMHVALSHCAGMLACDFDVRPGEVVPITADDPARPFLYAYVPRGWEQSLTFSTVAHRTDVVMPEADVSVPAVPAHSFGSHRVTIANVPFVAGTRLNLRLYTIGRTPSATVRVTTDRVFTATLPVYVTNYYTEGDFQNRFPGVTGNATVEIETDAKVWAFITATDRDWRTTVLLPGERASRPATEARGDSDRAGRPITAGETPALQL